MTYYLNQTATTNTLLAVNPEGVIVIQIREEDNGVFSVDTCPGEKFSLEPDTESNITRPLNVDEFDEILFMSWRLIERQISNTIRPCAKCAKRETTDHSNS